jgi:nanoRNase/pAp phosphatase (c-di-AMP/oligoRNAs hydrolase)
MVDTKKKIAALRKILDSARKTLILTHDNPDPDAIAASLGWQYLLRSVFELESTIAYGGLVGRAENQSMIQHLRISMTPLERINFQDYSHVALVDTQPMTGNNSLPESVIPDMVIDHHPLRDQTRKVPFYDVREKVGASSSIVVEYLRIMKVPIQPRLVTALYYGIKSDTQDLGRRANPLDMDNYLFLFPQVQRELLNRIVHPKVSADYFRVLNRAFKKARIHGTALTTSVGRTRNPDMVAEVADMLLRHEGVEWVLTLGTHRKALILSIRTSDLRGGAGILAQDIVRGVGTAGGHGMIAGGQVEIKKRKAAELEELIQERFLKKVGSINEPAEALV